MKMSLSWATYKLHFGKCCISYITVRENKSTLLTFVSFVFFPYFCRCPAVECCCYYCCSWYFSLQLLLLLPYMFMLCSCWCFCSYFSCSRCLEIQAQNSVFVCSFHFPMFCFVSFRLIFIFSLSYFSPPPLEMSSALARPPTSHLPATPFNWVLLMLLLCWLTKCF